MSGPHASLRTSLLYSFAEKYTLLLLNIVGSMVIARLLTPAEIGLYAVGAVLVGLVQALRDFGVGQYLVQDKELNRQTLRAALALSMMVAWLLAALVLLASAPLARLYHEARLEQVMRLLAINFVLLPFTSLSLPLLRRQMRFPAIFGINVTSSATNLLVSVALALLGFSYLSLALAAVAGNCAGLLAGLWLRPAGLPWLPALRGVRKLLSFGALSTGGGLIDEAGVAAPDLIIGKMLDVAAVAVFGKAVGLLGVFNQAITSAVSPVVFPLYAQQARDGGDVRRAYLTTVSYITALSWPFFGFLALLATPLVNLLYGSQWDAAVPLVRIMCCSSAIYSVFSMARYLFVATGHVKAQARLDLHVVPVRIAVIALAAPHGLHWVAWAVVAGMLFRGWLTYRYLHKFAAIDALALARALARSLWLSGLALSPALLVVLGGARWNGAGAAPGWPLLLLAGAAAALGWIVGVVALGHPIVAEFAALRRKLRGPAAALFKP